MSNSQLFVAPSPKDGQMKTWEALVEFSTPDPYLFASKEVGDEEEYKPKDEGYKTLLKYYKEMYPDE